MFISLVRPASDKVDTGHRTTAEQLVSDHNNDGIEWTSEESASHFITHWSLVQATVHLVASSSFHALMFPTKTTFKADFPHERRRRGVKGSDIITRWKKTWGMMDGWWWKHLPPHREWLSKSVDAWMSKQVLCNSVVQMWCITVNQVDEEGQSLSMGGKINNHLEKHVL